MNKVRLTYSGPAALAGVFVSLLQKQHLTVTWTQPSTVGAKRREVIIAVAIDRTEESIVRTIDQTVKQFQDRFPLIGIDVNGRE